MSDTGVYKFTQQIQVKILATLWRTTDCYSLYKETIKPKYFSKSIHVDLCRIIFDYYAKYETSPSIDALIEEVFQMCEKSKTKQKIQDDYLDCISKMGKLSLDDLDYIKDKIVYFGKRQALVDAIMDSANILEKESIEKYDTIEKKVKDALLVGENLNDLGTDLFENIEERFESYTTTEDVIERIPTGMEQLDKCTGGGIGRTEMLVVIAPPGKGKTLCLTSMGANAIEEGYNVLHISLENNEKQIIRNYDTRLLKKNMDYIKENTDKSIKAMFNIKKFKKGKLRVKKYPTKTATVSDIRNLLDQLKSVKDFIPDVLIVDYGMIMKSDRNYTDKRSGIEDIYESLRAVADDYNCALYTAAQGNRGSLSKKIVTTADLAECFAIANTSDICFALCQTNKEKQQSIMRGFLSKNRDNPDGLVLKGKILYDIKKLDFTELVKLEDQGDEDDTQEDDWGV